MAAWVKVTEFSVLCISMCKILPLLFIIGALLTFNLCADSIEYQISPTSTPGLYEFDYILTGLTFSQGDELDISFDPTIYGCLGGDPSTPGCGSATASSDFTYMVNQPDNPAGAPGDFYLIANISNPSLAGTFSVDFEYAAGISAADAGDGSQPWTVYDFPADGSLTVTDSGMTVPEPANASLSAVTLLVLGAFALRRRLRGTA